MSIHPHHEEFSTSHANYDLMIADMRRKEIARMELVELVGTAAVTVIGGALFGFLLGWYL